MEAMTPASSARSASAGGVSGKGLTRREETWLKAIKVTLTDMRFITDVEERTQGERTL